MSGAELIVIGFGGLIGYLIVMAVLSRGKGGKGKTGGADCDRVLGIEPQAGEEEVHAAYRRLIARYAPEQLDQLDAATRVHAEQEAKWIEQAYREAMIRRGVKV